MILRRLIAAVALLCACSSSYAQTGRALSATQLNAEINQLFIDQTNGAITPFGLRQVTLDMVASGIIGNVTLTGDVGGTGSTTIPTTIGPTVLGVATFTMKQTFSGGITGLPSPTNPSDAANKTYVDSVASGITVLAPSALATTTVLPNTPTYSNGTLGVGATLTAGSNSTLTVDSTVAVLNTVVLVKNQSSAFQNGIYTVTTAGSGSAAWVLTRATYFNIAAQMKSGSYTLITGGTVNANSAFTLQTAVTTVGTDPLNWLLFSQGSPGVASGGAVIATRAAAAALNLSNFTTITTQGYANPGDGGGATFQNVGTATFIDSYLSTGFVNQAGSGCTNGANQIFGTAGGHGTGAIFTVTVTAGSVTSASFNSTPGNGYAVADQVTFPGLTCSGSTPNWQVSTVTTPTGSFTDSAGNHWQIINQNNAINIRQFGAKVNWNPTAGDAGSTSDTAAIQNAMNFAYYANGTINSVGAGGVVGNRVIVPAGAALTCNLTVPYGVWLDGAGKYSSTLKECDGMAATLHFVTLCDSTNHLACFGTRLTNIGMFPGASSANSNIAMIFSNSLQQDVAIDHVVIQSGVRSCINFDTGYGGAALIGIYSIECGPNNASTNPAIILGYSAAVQIIRDSVVETSSWTGFGIVANTGGVNIISGIHSEGITQPIYFNNTGTGGTINYVEGITGGGGCTYLITRQGGSNANQIKAGSLVPNGCTNTINNAGALTTGIVVADVVF